MTGGTNAGLCISFGGICHGEDLPDNERTDLTYLTLRALSGV